MNTKVLLGASALVMGLAGVAGMFLPQELLAAGGLPAAGVLVIAVQLFAAALMGFAINNWSARGSLIGGIYNRPLALGNLLHFAVGAMALLKVAVRGGAVTIVAAVVYSLFAVGFGLLVFGPSRQAAAQ